MDRCDVLIVGGGPGGSSCAWRLSSAGMDVLVLDKQLFPRDKTCAGWITPPVVDVLEIDVDDYRRDRMFQPIRGFRTGLIGGEQVNTLYGKTVSYGIRRCEFDHYLLQRCGARCRLGSSVTTIERAGGRWIVNGQFEAALIVGAGGHFCPVARFLRGRQGSWGKAVAVPQPSGSGGPRLLGLRPLSPSHPPVVAAQEVEFEVAREELDRGRISAGIPELFFCDDLQGYGWCIRKGNFLNIGLGRVGGTGQKPGFSKKPGFLRLSLDVRKFCDFLREREKICCRLPSRFHGHAYQLYAGRTSKLLDDGVLLVGDAAGLAYPQSGEGIRPAVESGLMAADAILAAGGHFSRQQLELYRDRILERFGRPRPRALSDWLPAGWLHFLASRLLGTEWFSRHVVLDRWFLHAGEAVLPREAPAPMRGTRSLSEN